MFQQRHLYRSQEIFINCLSIFLNIFFAKINFLLNFLLIKVEGLDFSQLEGNEMIKPFVLIIVGVMVVLLASLIGGHRLE